MNYFLNYFVFILNIMNKYKKMRLLHIVHDVVEIGSHLGGAVGSGFSAVDDLGSTIADIKHHDYLGALEEGGKTLIEGAESISDASSGNWF